MPISALGEMLEKHPNETQIEDTGGEERVPLFQPQSGLSVRDDEQKGK